MERDGFALPVVEATASTGGRRGTTTSSRSGRPGRCCRRCACGSTTAIVRAGRRTRLLADGHTVHASLDPQRQARAGCPTACAASRRSNDEGTGHRRRRVHRVDARGTARAPTAPTSSASTASPTTTRARSRSGTLPRSDGQPAFRFVETTHRRPPTWRRLLADRTHVFHLAAQAGVRKSWGRDFDVYTVNNIEATQVLLEALRRVGHRAAGLCVELVGLRRRGRDSDAGGRAAAAGVAVRRHQAGGRTAVPPVLTSTTAFPTVSLRYFTVYGPRQRPDMGFHRFLHGGHHRSSRSPSSATASRRATSRSWRCGGRDGCSGHAGTSRAACTILEAARASR